MKGTPDNPTVTSADSAAQPTNSEFETVFRSHYNYLRGYATTFTVPGMTADDLVAEGVLRMLRSPCRGGVQHPVGYLRTVIRNVAVERITRAEPLTFVADVTLLRRARPARQDEPPESDDEVRQAFAALPHRWRMVLFRLVVVGEPIQTVADDMELTPNAVRSLAHRARGGLRHALAAAA